MATAKSHPAVPLSRRDRGVLLPSIEARRGSGTAVASPGTGASGPFDAVRLLREAQYPGRLVVVEDPDGIHVHLTY